MALFDLSSALQGGADFGEMGGGGGERLLKFLSSSLSGCRDEVE